MERWSFDCGVGRRVRGSVISVHECRTCGGCCRPSPGVFDVRLILLSTFVVMGNTDNAISIYK